MENIDILGIVLSFIGGLGLFLFGMNYMGEGLQKSAGSKMKKLLGVLTNNPFLGVLVGAGATAIIQSSSATTVMVVGFVNAGLMSLKQAVAVIMGANVGTTITAWIVSLGEWSKFLKPATLAPIAIGIGVIITMFCKKEKIKQIGEIILGFGVLFIGLDLMGEAVKPLSELKEIEMLFRSLGENPIICILTGAIITAIIQSSSASVTILQTVAASMFLPWNTAIYIILGQNIGTTITAMLSSIGASKNARRAAVIHVLFNVLGSVFFAILAFVTFSIVDIPNQGITMTQISIPHTVFNILNTLLLFPLRGMLVYLAEHLISGSDKAQEQEEVLQHLDDRILENPSFAVENCIKEVIRMGEIASKNGKLALEALVEGNTEKIQEVYRKEKVINKLQHGINHYLVKLSNQILSEEEHSIITGLFHSVSDIERVGDHAENIVELAESLINAENHFSEVAIKEIQEISDKAFKCLDMAIEAYADDDFELAKAALPFEQEVDQLEEELRATHIRRLTENKCSQVAGIVFLDAISNIERISDHASNIAMTILDEKKLLKV